MWLLGAAFALIFLAVFAAGWLLFVRRKPDPCGSPTWTFSVGGSIPASPETVRRFTTLRKALFSRREPTPEAQARLASLTRARGVFVRLYRILMVAIGLAGLAVAADLFRSATPGNMQALPAFLVLLLALGALLSGIFPRRSITGKSPIDRTFLDSIRIQVTHRDPVTVSLSSFDLQRAGSLIRQGQPASEAARAVYPGYDELDPLAKRALESALHMAVERNQ